LRSNIEVVDGMSMFPLLSLSLWFPLELAIFLCDKGKLKRDWKHTDWRAR
jgi:hypothetical protein